jgi:hypothetical protein
MAGKQQSVELGEIRVRDSANQDEVALARLGKKSVLKVCTSHLHALLVNISHSDNMLSTEKVWLSFYPGIQLHCFGNLGRVPDVST